MIYSLPAFRKTILAVLLFIAIKTTAQPTISSFTPSSGPLGTSVIITGTNFNAVPANNLVYFGAVKATITSGSTTNLTVNVPAGTTYQPISVLDNVTGLTGYSSGPFITTFTNPFGTAIPANFYKPKVDFAVGTNPRNIATSDVDGDGKADLVVANGSSNTISVLANTSSPGNITASSFASKVDFASGTFTEHVSIGDVDGDGKPDLVVVTNANISVLRNTSTAGSITASSFAAKIDFTSSSTGPVFGALGDVDGDGKPDIVTANAGANTVSVRRNTSTPGSISFATKIDFSTGGTPSSVAIGDVDGDGKPDLVTSNAAASANTVSVLRNTTAGTISFGTKVDFATGPIPRSVAIGDVDGDGNPDLVVANNATSPSISTTISVLRNMSTPGSITASSFAAKVDFTAGSAPRSISIGDLDGDGKPDVVVANMNSNNISVLRNTSTPGSITASSFAAKVDFTAGASPVSAVIVDVEGDGIPEIAVANGATSTSLGVSVFQINSASAPNAGTVSGTSPLCIEATATYTSNGDAGGTWSSTSTSIATVNATTGLVTAVSAGTTNITYTVSGVSSFKSLTVSPSVTAGTVSGTSPLNISGTATYTSNGTAGGTWSSTNTSVATVNATTGLVTAVSAGTTNITYTVNSGCGSPVSAFKTLTVNAPTNAGIVSGTSPLCIGATATYTSNGDAGGSWSSTNTSIATVNATTGSVTALSAGTTDITYTVSGVSSFKSLIVSPNVSAGTVSGATPLCIGATATYNSNGTAGGAWSSTNTSVATVNATTGLVTAVSAGTTNITYTVNNGCGSPVSVFATLTVSPNVNAGTVSGTTPLCIGGTATYSSNGTSGGAWSSTNTSVATVNTTTGSVTAVAAGTTDITYTVASGCGNPVSSFKTLTISPNVSAGTVSGTSPLNISGTATYTSNGTAGGTWSSTNTSVATVNATTGFVTAVSAGTTNITYTVSSGCGSPVSSFKTLTVNAATNAGTVSGTSPLCIGATATYTSNGDAGGSWSSTNTSVATVNATTGSVTAVSAGTTDITYTVSGVSSFKTLTVSPNVSAGTVSGTSPLNIGGTATYTSNGTAGGTWSSTNTSVATVNATTGFVTAVSAGTTNITYTVNSGCGSPVSAFKTLTVNVPTNAGIVSGTSPLCIGATATYSSNGDAGGTWSSTNTSIATVNATTGSVTAVSAGTTDITYTVSGVSSFKTLTISPNVSAGTVSGTSSLNISGTATYTSNGTAGGTWSSTNTSVATVNATTGFVTAVSAGTTNITYTVSSGCGSPVSSFKTLTVNAPTNAGIVSGTSPLCIGATATYSSNGDAGGTWSSTNTSIATVNATTGSVTAVSAGTTDITYTVSGVSSFKTLTVNPNVIPSVSIGASVTTICAGINVTFTATPTNGGTPAYQWKLNGANVGTNSATYQNSSLANGNTVTVLMTSSLACANPVTATSNTITMTVQSVLTFYRDLDGDSYGNAVSGTAQACIAPTGYVTSNTDCDDNNASIHPGAAEICENGLDENCNGEVDENCPTSDDHLPKLVLRTYPEKEGDNREHTVDLKIMITKASKKTITVRYVTENGTALSGIDYKYAEGLIQFAPGKKEATITLTIIGDIIRENNEIFNLKFSNGMNVTIPDDKTSRVLIIDDDQQQETLNAGARAGTDGKDAVRNFEELNIKVPSLLHRYQPLAIKGLPNTQNSFYLMDIRGVVMVQMKQFTDTWTPGNLAPGIYIYQLIYLNLKGEPQRKTGKILITD